MLVKLGDMLIASAVPKALKMQQPGTHVSWLVDGSCAEIVRMNQYVDEVIVYSWDSISALENCCFDLVLGFERERAAAALVEKVRAVDKRGLAFGGPQNTLYPLCKASEYFFRLNVWNEFRTRINTKTWTEFYFELAGLRFNAEPYELKVSPAALVKANGIVSELTSTGKSFLLCNVGGSLNTKLWPYAHWAELITAVLRSGLGVVLTYGAMERSMVCQILELLPANASANVLAPDTTGDLATLAALFQLCLGVVTGDTLGMHLAFWAHKPVVALFGPSNPAEVVPKHLTNIKLIRSKLECSPCAHQVLCGGAGGCMAEITVESALEHLNTLLERKQRVDQEFLSTEAPS